MKVSLNTRKLSRELIKVRNEAKKHYAQLKEPRTLSEDLYADIGVKRFLSDRLFKNEITPTDLQNPPASLKATAAFHLIFSEDTLETLKESIFGAEVSQREKVWKRFNLPLTEIDNSFKKMIKERNALALNKGYRSRVEMALAWDGIPAREYRNFIEGIDKIIYLCNQKLPNTGNLNRQFYSEFNIPCFVCLANPHLKTINQVFNFVITENKTLSKFKEKINFRMADRSEMVYRWKFDDFLIIIDDNLNFPHQVSDMIHELSHIIAYLQDFKKEVNPLSSGLYRREKKAIGIEIQILRNFFPELYSPSFLVKPCFCFGELFLKLNFTGIRIKI